MPNLTDPGERLAWELEKEPTLLAERRDDYRQPRMLSEQLGGGGSFCTGCNCYVCECACSGCGKPGLRLCDVCETGAA